MNIKKILLITIASFFMLGAEALADDVKIRVNGKYIETDTAPIIEDGRTLVPVRAISEALECDVSWNDEKRAVSVFDGEDLAVMWIGRDTAFKTDGMEITGHYTMDVSPKIINDRTMVPIRAISELLGAEVDWINDERTVTIAYVSMGYEGIEGAIESFNPVFINGLSDMYDGYRDYVGEKKNVTLAEIELEGGKVIKLELYNGIAPKSVENFIKLAESKAFDGKIFHRVIENFMIQGGAFDENNVQATSDSIYGEFTFNGWLNLVPHTRGAISMARTPDPDSGSNQFFIVHKESVELNGSYAVFGNVLEGMEYVDEIAGCETDSNDKPIKNQVIKTVKIIK